MMQTNIDSRQDPFQSVQTSQSLNRSHLGRLPARNLCSASPATRSFTTYGIPIIPSVHSHQGEVSCMQTADAVSQGLTRQRRSHDDNLVGPHGEVDRLQEEGRERLREIVCAKSRQEDTVFASSCVARETVCVLLPNAGGLRGMAPSGPTETQLLNPTDVQGVKDSTQLYQ